MILSSCKYVKKLDSECQKNLHHKNSRFFFHTFVTMTIDERYRGITEWFSANMENPQTELVYSDPWSLLVAVVLSAQCTDKRVNMVTPPLMRTFETPQAMANSSVDEIFEYIKSVSYPNAKAEYLFATAKILAQNGGEVPSNREQLESLPGVGRKTANVVLSVAFGIQTMPVDTHVFRLAHRIGLVNQSDKNPLLVEKKLVAHFDNTILSKAHHWLILHGRYVCTAKNPKCNECGIKKYCKFAQQKQMLER